MAQVCIPKQDALKLAAHFKTTGLSINDLYNMDSAGRRSAFEDALDPETAMHANVLFEKAMLSQQKQAIANWVWKNVAGGDLRLYAGVTPQISEKLRANMQMSDLRGKTPAQVETMLARHIDPELASTLSKRFGSAQKSGNLSNWERKTFATKEILEDKKLKGAFARLEALNDLGVLTPPQMDRFMQDYVSDLMKVSIDAEQSKELAAKTTALSDAYDAVGTDWTSTNYDAVMDYYRKRKELDTFVNKLDPASALDVFVDVGARGSILFSLRSLSNSFLYQLVPTVMRGVVKRLSANTMIPSDVSMYERASAALSGSFTPSQMKKMSKDVAMAMKIYYETGFDIARMENLSDGTNVYFGEKFTHTEGPTFKEAKGIAQKLGWAVRGHAKLVTPGLKWMAGGTDTLLANIHRTDTSAMLAKTIATAEEKAGKLTGSVDDRIKELYQESLSPNPKSDEGKYIRTQGILDANHANFTNNDIYGNLAIKIRDALGIGNATVGKLLLPFMKIPAQALGVGLEMSGPGLIRGTQQLISGLRMESGNDKQVAISEGIAKLLTSGGGLALAAIFVSALLDDDDYIGAYDYRDQALSTSKNAGANMVRIGGNWYSTQWFGPLGIPISAMMEARQARARGSSATIGYLTGMLTGALQFPGIKQIGDLIKNAYQASKQEGTEGVAKAFKISPADVGKWVAARTVTSTVTNDIWGFHAPYKYDPLGRQLPHKADDTWMAVTSFFIGTNIRHDTSNAVTKEFDALRIEKNLPSLADPKGINVKAVQKSMGEDEYVKYLNTLKQDYAKSVDELIKTDEYFTMMPNEKKKAIDGLRNETIMKPIRDKADELKP